MPLVANAGDNAKIGSGGGTFGACGCLAAGIGGIGGLVGSFDVAAPVLLVQRPCFSCWLSFYYINPAQRKCVTLIADYKTNQRDSKVDSFKRYN